MIINTHINEDWSISEELQKQFDRNALIAILSALNRMYQGNFFFIDYFHREIIVDSEEAKILSAYSTNLLLKDKLGFFKRILTRTEFQWQQKLSQPAMDVFYGLSEENRLDLIFLNDVAIKPKYEKRQIVHCKSVPFHLCNNGNLWLMLVCMSSSVSRKGQNSCILDFNRNMRYEFAETEFVAHEIKTVTDVERRVLKLLMRNASPRKIYTDMGVSRSTFQRLQRSLFEHLEVKTLAAAIQRARQLGLI